MVKWEYQIVRVLGDDASFLNVVGNDGWEAFAVVPAEDHSETAENLCYMKRQHS